jgi:formylglycine-generating enzyme required for sulfatase activity
MKYYQILDLPPDATEERIKTAYRILVQLHHPDRLQQVSAGVREYAEERLKKINEAYRVLGDPERRARYDADQRQSGRRGPGGFAGFTDYDEPASDDAQDGAWEASRRRSRQRTPTAEQAAAQAAYEEWSHQEADRYAAAREAERARRDAREAHEAEQRARRAADEQFPRAHLQGNDLVVNFAPGVWTTLLPVTASAFVMGSEPAADPEASSAESPQHRVRVSKFYVAQYPVTNAQYAAFARAANRPSAVPAAVGHETHPVTNVSWDDAITFCQWLSDATGRGFRLPTEAEWEKAARGPDARRYPWGDEWDPARLNCESRYGGLTAAGRFSPAGDSPFGAADLLGNVWEWCGDWFDAGLYARRANRPVSDPLGPSTGRGYVVRGGAFDSPPKHTRCTHRNWYYPDTTRPNLGFRIIALPR